MQRENITNNLEMNITEINNSNENQIKQKERAIGRVNDRIKIAKKHAIKFKRTLQKVIATNDKKLEKVMKKKQKLCTENKRLTSANVRLKKSIANRNEKIYILIDEKEELVCELNILYSENEVNEVNIETMRDHKNCKV